jgi:hypothetical protein
LKRRGLAARPELAIADGGVDFWKVAGEVWPKNARAGSRRTDRPAARSKAQRQLPLDPARSKEKSFAHPYFWVPSFIQRNSRAWRITTLQSVSYAHGLRLRQPGNIVSNGSSSEEIFG